MENKSILEQVHFLLRAAKNKDTSQKTLKIVSTLTKKHSNDRILGRVFGHSVSDYAFATLKWIGTKESIDLFNMYSADLPAERESEINNLIEKQIYQEL